MAERHAEDKDGAKATGTGKLPKPLDAAASEHKLVSQTYYYSIGQLASDVAKKRILFDQGDYFWDDAEAGRLVESLLLDAPVPECHFAENEDGSWEVLDGLQRVYSVVRFLRGEFPLGGLSVLTELNGKRFDDLSARDQRRLELRTMRFVVMSEEPHPAAKLDVFEPLRPGQFPREGQPVSSEDEYGAEAADAEEILKSLDFAPNERRLVTQPYEYSIGRLAFDVAKKRVLFDQGDYFWDDAEAGRLVESLLLDAPVPECHFAENEDGSWEVLDGLQRVYSVVRFLRGEFPLGGLSVLTALNGKRFDDLPARDQRVLELRTLRFIVMSEEPHPDAKLDVFGHLENGAVKLTPQELRNYVYRGEFNDGLRKLARDETFRTAIGCSNSRMRDEELILRFLALYADLPGYQAPVTQFLNEYMRRHRERQPDPAAVREFLETMQTAAAVFESAAFRTRNANSVNRALFDAVALSIAYADKGAMVKKAPEVVDAHRRLLEDPGFLAYIGRATVDRGRMHGRVRSYTGMLVDLGIGSSLPQLS